MRQDDLKMLAILSKIDGVVHIEEIKTTRNVIVTNHETNESETYMVPYNFKIRVKENEVIEKGYKAD